MKYAAIAISVLSIAINYLNSRQSRRNLETYIRQHEQRAYRLREKERLAAFQRINTSMRRGGM